jgi:hypothetical protein
MPNEEKKPGEDKEPAETQTPVAPSPLTRTPVSHAGTPDGYTLQRRSDGFIEVWKGGRQIGNSLPTLDEASSFAKSDREAAADGDRDANQNGTKGDSQDASQPKTEGVEPDSSQPGSECDEPDASQPETEGVEPDSSQPGSECDEPDASQPETGNDDRQQSPKVGVDETRRRPRPRGR